MAMERRDDNFVFEIKAHLGVISTRKDGWKRELNLVSWNGQNPPKFDIRDWSDDHTKMSKGITLYNSEMHRIMQFYSQFCNARVISESRNSRNAAAQAGLRAGEEASEMSRENQEQEAGAAKPSSDVTETASGDVASSANEAGTKESESPSESAASSEASKDSDSDILEVPAEVLAGAEALTAQEEGMPF